MVTRQSIVTGLHQIQFKVVDIVEFKGAYFWIASKMVQYGYKREVSSNQKGTA
uniref:Uncharacterized protein n=1 Tax=Arundo donax TaxID=35708 RepID=A0A0A9FMV7_ARUDO